MKQVLNNRNVLNSICYYCCSPSVSVKQRLGGPIFDDSRIESTEDAQSASATPQEPSFEAEDKPGRKRKQRDAEEDEEIMGTNFIKRNIEVQKKKGVLAVSS